MQLAYISKSNRGPEVEKVSISAHAQCNICQDGRSTTRLDLCWSGETSNDNRQFPCNSTSFLSFCAHRAKIKLIG